MIKKFNLYKESLLDKISGPSNNEIYNNFKKMLTENKISFSDYINKLDSEGIIYEREKEIVEYLNTLEPNEMLFFSVGNKILSLEGVKLAISKGADVNEKNQFYMSVLEVAILNKSKEITIYLIEQGAKLNMENELYYVVEKLKDVLTLDEFLFIIKNLNIEVLEIRSSIELLYSAKGGELLKIKNKLLEIENDLNNYLKQLIKNK